MSEIDASAPNIWPPPLVPIEAFDIKAINTCTDQETSLQMWRLSTLLMSLAESATKTGSSDALAMRVIAGAASIVMSPSSSGHVWGPRHTSSTSRTPSPQDFLGGQNHVLSELAHQLRHPALRAHIADMTWTNNRKAPALAALAVESYVDCAVRLLPVPASALNVAGLHSSVLCITRALQIDKQVRKRGDRSTSLLHAFNLTYQLAKDKGEVVAFTRLVDIALHYKLTDAVGAAGDLESAAANAPDNGYPIAKAEAYCTAAVIYESLQNREGRVRCLLAAAEAQLAMRSRVSGSGARAHWVQQALYTLRGLREAEPKRRLLRSELRDEQEDSLDNMTSFDFPHEVEAMINRSRDDIDTLDIDLSDLLYQVLMVQPIPTYEDFKAKAQLMAKEGGVVTLFGIGHIDDQGRTAGRSSPPAGDGSDEEWIKTSSNQSASINRQMFIVSTFEPVVAKANSICNLREEHFRVLVESSPFVPVSHWGIVSHGLLRLFQGDYRSAVHLLVPQLEPCLRHVLRVMRCDPSVEYEDLTEEDISISTILKRFDAQLCKVFTKGLVFEMDLIFNHRSGPALRHNVAHGRLMDGGCFSASAIYGCWFFYRLVGLPLTRTWDLMIAPKLRALNGE